MTPEAVKEASRLLFQLDRSEHLLKEVRSRPELRGVDDMYLPGETRHDSIFISALYAETESTGVKADALATLIREQIDATIDAHIAVLRGRLMDLGVDLPVREVPLLGGASDEALS